VAGIIDGFYAMAPENHDRLCFLFLDEVHALPDWSRLVRRLQDTRKVRLHLTGTSARMLSREIATEHRGRSLATEVWPYSFKEWLRAGGPGGELRLPRPPYGQRVLDQFRPRLLAYLEEGGFPEVRNLDPALRLRILQEYVDVVVFRDVVERHRIANLALARYLTRTLLRGVGRSLSINKIHNDLKSQGRGTGKNTLYEYLAYFEDAFLCFAVPLHEASPRKAETALKKIYAVDPGLVTAFRMGAEDLGQRFENLVYLDLRRQGCEVSYYLTRSGREVDFLARHADGRRELLQACWDAGDPETLRREREALAEAREELGLEGRLVTMASYLEQQAD
jgi:predicted AAA+ superfamily ATPase